MVGSSTNGASLNRVLICSEEILGFEGRLSGPLFKGGLLGMYPKSHNVLHPLEVGRLMNI